MKYILFTIIFIINSIGLSQTTKWKVIWDRNPEDDIKEYIVYKDDKEISRVKSSDTVYVDTKLEPSKLYSYRIRAVNEKNIPSDYSEPAIAAIPGFLELPTILGISKTNPIKLLLKKYINDPDDKVHEIVRINKSSDSKVSLTLEGSNLIFKAESNWNEDDIDTVEIKVIDSNEFFNVAKIIIKDDSVVEDIIYTPTQELDIKIYPLDFSLSQYNKIIISYIPQDSNISIYDSFGTLVFSEKNISNKFLWKAENNNGSRVLFGLYNFVLYDKMNKILSEGSFRVIP